MAKNKDDILFVRDGEVDNNDPWDDSVLIRAYNNALAQSQSTIGDNPELMEAEPEVNKIEPPKKWKKWDPCRAVYSVDGLTYEATILSIKKDKCLVKFRGYANKETVPLDSLTKSKGSKAVKDQIRAARLESTEEIFDHDEDVSLHSEETGCSSRAGRHYPPPLADMLPPPPPPAPPMFSRSGEALGSNDAFHAMLMSWFMSGYHTGYYECLKRFDSKR